MAIAPINNAVIQRTDDVGQIRRHEDAKPMLDQQNIQTQVDRREDVLRHQVIGADESERAKNDADARDEGKGKYQSRRGSVRKKGKDADKPGCMVKKKSTGGFDIKV